MNRFVRVVHTDHIDKIMRGADPDRVADARREAIKQPPLHALQVLCDQVASRTDDYVRGQMMPFPFDDFADAHLGDAARHVFHLKVAADAAESMYQHLRDQVEDAREHLDERYAVMSGAAAHAATDAPAGETGNPMKPIEPTTPDPTKRAEIAPVPGETSPAAGADPGKAGQLADPAAPHPTDPWNPVGPGDQVNPAERVDHRRWADDDGTSVSRPGDHPAEGVVTDPATPLGSIGNPAGARPVGDSTRPDVATAAGEAVAEDQAKGKDQPKGKGAKK